MEKNNKSNCVWASVSLLLAVTFSATNTQAQQNLESNYRLAGPGVTAAFEEQRQAIQISSAEIQSSRKRIAYGVVISPDGYILTKASEVAQQDNLSVIIDRTNHRNVQIVMTDATWDVALLKIDAENLTPISYANNSDVSQGTWVVVNGVSSRTNRRVLAGVVSAKIREIPPAGGAVLGVTLDQKSKSLKIAEVHENSGAQEAGLAEGDVIVAVDGKKVSKIEDLTEAIKDMRAGAIVKLTLKREKKEIDVEVRLSARGELFEEISRNDAMSGDFSKRRSGFPRVLQHDILGNSSSMGGPVLDLDGRAIGMNIARANRAETFAIPVEDLKKLAEGMLAQARN